MSVTVSIKVKKELVELAEKMVRFGMAKSRSHAFNLMLNEGVAKIKEEVEFWESVHAKVRELERNGFKLKHGGLSKLLEGDRAQ